MQNGSCVFEDSAALAAIEYHLERGLSREAPAIYQNYHMSVVHGPLHARDVGIMTAYILSKDFPETEVKARVPLLAGLLHDVGHIKTEGRTRSVYGKPVWDMSTKEKSDLSEEHAAESCRVAKEILKSVGYKDWEGSAEVFVPILLHPARSDFGRIEEKWKELRRELLAEEVDDVSKLEVTQESLDIARALRPADKLQKYAFGSPVRLHMIDGLYVSLMVDGKPDIDYAFDRAEEHIREIERMELKSPTGARMLGAAAARYGHKKDYFPLVRDAVYANMFLLNRAAREPGWLHDTYVRDNIREIKRGIGEVSKAMEENSDLVEKYVDMGKYRVEKVLERVRSS